jgi:hypothetical protein
MNNRKRAAAAALGVSMVLAGASIADAASRRALPAVNITATAGKVAIAGAGSLKQGPTRINISGSNKGGKELDLTLFQLKAGVAASQVLGAAAKLKGPPTPLQKYGKFVMSSDTQASSPSYSVDLLLVPATYLVVDSTAKPTLDGSFTVGTAASGVAASAPAATITLTDFKIAAPATLPASGTLRFQNRGASPHFVALIRTKSMATAMSAVTLLKQGKDAKAQKLATGEQSLVGLISPGVTNDVPVRGLKPGSYVLACFYGDARSNDKEHSMLGMETMVTVK